MYRAFLKPRAGIKALASASTVAATATLTLSSDPQKTQKLSIYPETDSETILLDTPSPLEHQIGHVRRKITDAIRQARDEGQGIVNKWIGVEQAVEKRVKSIVSPNEQITAGLLYTGITTLTGSIIARNRSHFVRFALPSALFIVSLNHFLPETAGNLSSYLGSVEERYLPKVAEKHAIANVHARMTWERVKESTREGREWAGRSVDWGVRRVQEVTGLKLRNVVEGEEESKSEARKAD